MDYERGGVEMQRPKIYLSKRKYQCFISSTFDDLRLERAESITGVLEAGQIPVGMEFFEAGRPQKEIIEKWMDESDMIIFLIGGRYGTIDPTTGNSYLEDEYDYALKKRKIHFSIVLSEFFLSKKNADELQKKSEISVYEEKNKSLYKKFRNKVCRDENVAIVNSVEEIKNVIMRNIISNIWEGRLTGGWIAYGDYSNKDISEMNTEDRARALFELLKKNFSGASDRVEEEKITNQFCNILRQYDSALKRFMTTMARAIEVILYDEYIEVHNTVNITYKIAPNTVSGFVYNPWLYEGIESETFQIEELKYNHEKVEKKYIEKGVAEYTSNPFYVTNVVKVYIPFDNKQRQHKIKYSTRYRTDYDRYFHEYSFKEFCQFFSLTVSLNDRRTSKKEKEYMLKWVMFTPYKTYDHSSQNMLAHDKDKLTFNAADLMIPGNGYVITLNSASPGIIKMMNN